MPSEVDAKKRVLVTLLKRLARKYNLQLSLVREATDAQVGAAFRRVIKQAHPDKRGSAADAKELNAARDAWEEAKKARRGQGRQPQNQSRSSAADAAPGEGAELEAGLGGKRVRATAAMFTYQGITLVEQWKRYLHFWREHQKEWGVKHWCATLESNHHQGYHIHVMVQFRKSQDCSNKVWAFEGISPYI